MLLNTGAEAPQPGEGLLTTVAWGLGEETDYALEAAVFVTGAAVQWLRDGLGIISEAAESEALAASLQGNDGVYFVPALTGLGSPHWDPYARGTIVGLTRGSGRAHLARAALEAIAYQTVDAVRAQEAASGRRLASLKADGGAVANRWLMQFQADVLGAPVIVPEITETTALGAAYLAGIATGAWSREGVAEMWRRRAAYEPAMSEDERRLAAGRLGPRARALARLGRGGVTARGGAGRNQRAGAPTRAGPLQMAEIKPQRYKDSRPAAYFEKFHERARADRQGGWVYNLARVILTLPTVLVFRTRAIGTENVPASGPVLLAPNHFSQMDHFFCAVYLRRKVRFMAKSQLFGPPVLTFIFHHGGAYPVRRGHADEEAFETSYAILEQGHPLLIYAEGGRSRSRNLGHAAPRASAASPSSRASRSSRSRSTARPGSAGWRRLRFPKVTVQYGEPVTFPAEARPSREHQIEAAEEIFDRVRTMYTALEEKGRSGVIRSLREGLPSPTPGRASPEG